MKDLTKVTTLLTHGSVFHSDDVFATALMKKLCPMAELVHTNDKNYAAEMNSRDDYLVYDIGEGEYDHHQGEGYAERPLEDGYWFDKDGRMRMIKYCSFGLLWRDYGRQLCPTESAWKKVDRDLVIKIDKADNGITHSDFAAAINVFNPNWNDDCSDLGRACRFDLAVQIATPILEGFIASANAIAAAGEEIGKHSEILYENVLVLNNYLPWHDVVVETMPDILFVVFPSSRHEGCWNVQTVPNEPGSFIGRKLFPEAWLGKTNDLLGITFCHPGNFLLEASSRDNAIHCAKIATEL